MRLIITFVCVFVLAVTCLPAPPAQAGCGILRGIGRVLGVQRRQERRAARNGGNGRVFRGGCSNGDCR